jgi:hypothetical protein
VQQVNEIGADQPGGGSAYRTTPEIAAEMTEEEHRMSTPGAYEYRLEVM